MSGARWPMLYKKCSSDRIMVWSIRVGRNENGSATVFTDEGYDPGEIRRSTLTILPNRNPQNGKGTNTFSQALAKCRDSYIERRAEGYVVNRSELGADTPPPIPKTKPN